MEFALDKIQNGRRGRPFRIKAGSGRKYFCIRCRLFEQDFADFLKKGGGATKRQSGNKSLGIRNWRIVQVGYWLLKFL